MQRLATWLAVSLLLLPFGSGWAQQSVYTDINLDGCAEMPGGDDGARVWLCPGFADYAVLVIERDEHYYVSFSPYFPEAQPAIYQALEPPGTINNVLEWRLDEAGAPVATILRYFLTRVSVTGDGEAQVLVVTKLRPFACHVAYIHAGLVADANELARDVADLVPQGFSCDAGQPLWFGVADEPGPFFDIPGVDPPWINDAIRAFVAARLER